MMHIFNIAAVIVVHWSRVALSEADCPSDGYCAGYGTLTAVPNDIPPLASQIHLQNNNISDINPGSFIKNTMCSTIRMEFNKLTTIRGNMWEGLMSLQYLYLGGNSIKTVEKQGFKNLPSLEGLYLENNKLRSLSQDIFHPDHPPSLELILLGNPFKKGDQRLCWIQRGKTKGWITSRLTTTIESLECSHTAKLEVQSSTGSTTGSYGVPGSRSNISVTEDMITEVTVTVTVTHDFSSHYALDDPTIKTIQVETKETSAPHETTDGRIAIGVGLFVVVVCLIIIVAGACFLHRGKLSQSCKKTQQTSVVEIELQTRSIEERPPPALPPSRATTTYSFSAHPPNTRPTPSRDSQGYLIPMDEPTESTAQSTSNEVPRSSGLYSYAYQHMVARIMAFLSIQRRGRVVTTRAEIHHHGRRRQRPSARRRPSPDPTSRVWSAQDSSALARDSSALARDPSVSTRNFSASTRDSSASTRNSLVSARDSSASARDSSASTRCFPSDASGIQRLHPQEMSSQTDSDYLEGLGTDETPNGSVYERIGDARRIGSVKERLDDERGIGSVNERLDDARRIGSVYELLDDTRRIGSVNDRIDDREIMTMLSNV